MRSALLCFGLLFGSLTHAQETKTSIGFSINPNISSLLYRNDGGFSDGDVELIKSGTYAELGLSGNLFFQYEVNDKFAILWGVGLQNYSSRSTYYSQSNIEHPTIIRETNYDQYYIQFNTSLKYYMYKSLYATAGIGVDLLAEQRAKRTETCPGCEYSYQGEDYSGIYNEAMMPASFGIGYELKLNDRLNLMTELFGSMSLTDALQTTVFSDQVQLFQGTLMKPHLQQRPFQLGCKIGIIRSF